MTRILLLLAFFSMVGASAAAPQKKVFDPYQIPEDSCVQLGCNVHAPERVSASRAVTSVFEPARRSCCSAQGGVCGCTNGESVCCDGAINPSCGCE